MYFISSNLLHNFLNRKYTFSLYKKKKKKNSCENTGQPDSTYNPINPNPFLTRIK